MQINRFSHQATRKMVTDAMPGTVKEIARQTGKGASTIKSHILNLRPQRVFIARWVVDHRPQQAEAVYQHGQGTDAPRPVGLIQIRDRAPLMREAACPLPDAQEPMVRFAQRTQPNSVFSLAGGRA